jgi:acyl-CoA synthetase (NDP forming)
MSSSRFTPEALRRLLNPRSVAIIGASATPGALGAAVLANLDRMGFTGDIHLVNPNRDRIGDRPCLKSADALPEGVDAAVLAIPRPAVLDTLRALVRRKAGAAVIFSAGFAEGGAEWAREQQEIARLAAESGMVVEGPNCLGLVNYSDRVALKFIDVRESARDGGAGIGIVSQSGAMAAVLGTMLAARAANVTCSISTGNEAASGAEDFLENLLSDVHTRVVGVIAEQFRQPQRFLALARRARAAGKFIVLLHPGRSGAARASAATHTGALAGDYAVMRTLVEHHGVLLADGLEEFADLLELMARCPVPPAGGAAILTESGAFKALALDLCEQAGLPLPELDAARAPALRAALPPFVPVSNPVDLTAQALVDPDLYRKALTTLLADDRFGCVVVTIIQADATDQKFSSILGALRQLRPAKPVIFAALDDGAVVSPAHIAELRALGVPYFPSPERALRAVAKAAARSARVPPAEPAAPTSPLAAPLPRGVVPEYRAKQLLAPLGITFSPGRLAITPEQAQAAATEIGFPVALKAQAAAIPTGVPCCLWVSAECRPRPCATRVCYRLTSTPPASHANCTCCAARPCCAASAVPRPPTSPPPPTSSPGSAACCSPSPRFGKLTLTPWSSSRKARARSCWTR